MIFSRKKPTELLHVLILVIIPGFLSTCNNSSKEIIIPEDIVILNRPQHDTGITGIRAHVFILFSIDCGSCWNRMPELEKVVKSFIQNNNKVSLILNGESLDTFLSEFPELIKYHLTIYYDRYNSFKFENSVENSGSIIIIIQSNRNIRILTLSQYCSRNKV